MNTGLLSADILVKPAAELSSVDRKTQQERLHYLTGYNLDEKASDRPGELTYHHDVLVGLPQKPSGQALTPPSFQANVPRLSM